MLNWRKTTEEPPSDPSSLTRSMSNLSLSKSKSLQRWRWTLRDKKRMKVIIVNFGELNTRILENIKLWCLGNTFGVDLQHMRRIESNTHARQLGFDVDARLQLAAKDADIPRQSLEILDNSITFDLRNCRIIEEKFSIMSYKNESLLVEYRSYAPGAPTLVDLDPRTRDLIDRLANLLHHPKETVFRTPPCTGWVDDPLNNRVALLFELPANSDPQPMSLLRILSPAARFTRPSLSCRIGLAHSLARCISQLQLVKWVLVPSHVAAPLN